MVLRVRGGWFVDRGECEGGWKDRAVMIGSGLRQLGARAPAFDVVVSSCLLVRCGSNLELWIVLEQTLTTAEQVLPYTGTSPGL